MTHKPLHTFIILLLMLMTATAAQAGKIYKWTDPDGSVHYSQTPPPDHKVKEMNVAVPMPSSGSSSNASATTNSGQKSGAGQKQAGNTPANKKQAEKQAALEKKNEENRKENCKRANKRLRTINAGGRFYDVNEEGERVYWDDDKRASELSDAQKSVDEWCK
jgi:hypothetical protein